MTKINLLFRECQVKDRIHLAHLIRNLARGAGVDRIERERERA
jgi:hypothetical protein